MILVLNQKYNEYEMLISILQQEITAGFVYFMAPLQPLPQLVYQLFLSFSCLEPSVSAARFVHLRSFLADLRRHGFREHLVLPPQEVRTGI